MSLIDIQPRSAAVRSVGPATLVTLAHGDLATLHREDAESYTMLVMNIAREISRRLRRVDGLLANLMIDVQDVWKTTVESQEKVS
jgi:CRP-like cAMP-binding protein